MSAGDPTRDKPGATVLIVDDDPENLRLLGSILSPRGYRVSVAKSGPEALAWAERQMPDLVILDVMMEGMDGMEVCRRLKAEPRTRDVPVLFLTGLSDAWDRTFEAGGVDFISKPFHAGEVLARVDAHLTIREQNETLRRIADSKERLLAIIAHDLRGSFGVLIGLLKGMLGLFDRLEPEEIRSMSERLLATSAQAHELLENLLSWSSLQIGDLEARPELVELGKVASASLDQVRQAAIQKGVDVRATLHDDVRALADPNMLVTVLRNLLANALKFTEPGGEVVVTSEEERGEVVVAVRDTGVGIPEEDCRRLFHEGERVQTRGTSGEKGTGLGLLLCQALVQENGGRIWVESEVGRGTTFRFTLPLP